MIPLPANDNAKRAPSALATPLVPPDGQIARALSAMLAAPARPWTVASLARIAGLSRAPFARRFSCALGTSPLRWLTAHRMDLARNQLIETDHALARLAEDLGYASEFAFAKAFKRIVGVAPGLYRRQCARLSTAEHTPFRAAA